VTDKDRIEEQNQLLKLIAKLLIEEKFEASSESEKAQFLSNYGLTNREIADILGKSESTISRQLS
jgi:DNA-binding NarL/FixJ family response regulator